MNAPKPIQPQKPMQAQTREKKQAPGKAMYKSPQARTGAYDRALRRF